jgi:hypothetical protein
VIAQGKFRSRSVQCTIPESLLWFSDRKLRDSRSCGATAMHSQQNSG